MFLAACTIRAGAQPASRFTDAAPRSDFAYVTRNGYAESGRKYFPQPMCGGVAVLDFDNDGWMDVYFTNGARFPALSKAEPAFHHALLRNRGNGTFEDVTARAGLAGEKLGFSFGAAAADFDNDGFTDLFIANAGPNALFRNQGDGTFRDVTAGAGLGKAEHTISMQGAWLDFDRDGRLDLFLSNYTRWTAAADVRCLRDDGVEFYCHPKTYPAVTQNLYRNLGGGRFADVSAASGIGGIPGKGMGVGIADVDGDGWTDIFLANDTERNFLFINQRDGRTFTEQALLAGVAYNDDAATVSAMGADVKDFDNDGWPDIFYNDLMGQTWGLFRSLRPGKGGFRYVSPATGLAAISSPYSGWSAAFVDYNNDGWKDLYSANGDVDSLKPNAEQHDTLFENMAGKRFQDVSAQLGEDFLRSGYQRGAAVADLNNDGHRDLIVTTLGRRPRILLNSGAGSGNWLQVRVAGGPTASRDSIGATVELTLPSGRRLYEHVTTSIGFLSSSDPRVHFGLGRETSALKLVVRWPGGATAGMERVPANRVVTVHEPRGTR